MEKLGCRNVIIAAFVAAILMLFFYYNNSEGFSKSGLAISDDDCRKLAKVYYHPLIKNDIDDKNYLNRICGKCRRNMVDFETGNYYTENGFLI